MSTAALITWIVTAGFGSYMLTVWASHGGTRGQGASHFPPPAVFGHFLLAGGGLVVWIIYLFADNDVLAWVAFVDLLVVATVGDLLVFRWVKDRRAVAQPAGGSTSVDLAEQRIPSAIVVLHGVFAVTTVILVLLTALEVGE